MFFSVGAENKVLKTVHLADFSLLLSLLNQRFANNLVLAPVIEDFIKDVDGVTAVPEDPDGWNRGKLICVLSLELKWEHTCPYLGLISSTFSASSYSQ